MKNNFNLVVDNWIKVFDDGTKEVSLSEFFKHAHEYEILAGESRQQDLSTLRFLLAIVQRVYAGETVESLLKLGKFDDRIQTYLSEYQDCFDMQGDNPFYQVTAEQYNKYTDERFKIKDSGKQLGVVPVKQFNRNVSESNNSPNLFSMISGPKKDTLGMPELVRWLIAYQNFTGTSDKSKAVLDYPIRVSAGYLYKTDPVYLRGENLFETLVLNFYEEQTLQRPVWEWDLDEYLEQIDKFPDNTSQIYTLLSRLIYIDWSKDKLEILATGLPLPKGLDPMTMVDSGKPRLRNLQKLHSYVAFELDKVFMLPALYEFGKLGFKDKEVAIVNCNYVGDPKNPSQTPVATVFEELQFNSNLFYYRKEDMLAVSNIAQEVVKAYMILAYKMDKIRHQKASRERVSSLIDAFEDRMLEFVKNWLLNPTEVKDFASEIEKFAKDKLAKTEGNLSNIDYRRSDEDGTTVFDILSIYSFYVRKTVRKYQDVI